LCRIAITTKGKYTALEAEAIEPLVELVSDTDSEVRTYALKVAFYCLKVSQKLLCLKHLRLSVWTVTFEPNGLWYRYLAFWFTLTLVDQSSRSQEDKCC